MSYDGYLALASVYDKLNAEIDYAKWADFFEECFARYGEGKPSLVLDLACGTGRMTCEMAKRGYDMIGVDGSIDMLSEAYSKDTAGILYLCQDMRELELYGTVGATLCCLDSLNYLTNDGDFKKVLSLVHNSAVGRIPMIKKVIYAAFIFRFSRRAKTVNITVPTRNKRKDFIPPRR